MGKPFSVAIDNVVCGIGLIAILARPLVFERI